MSYFYLTVLNEIAFFFDSGDSFRWMKLFLLVFLLLYTKGVQEHQQATWLSDHSQLTNSCTTKESSVKFCTHWSRMLQLTFTTIDLPLNPRPCQALNSIFCQGKCFHSLWRNVSKTRHASLSRKVTPWTFPYKMKQHRAYSVIVRPRKHVCDNQCYRKGSL